MTKFGPLWGICFWGIIECHHRWNPPLISYATQPAGMPWTLYKHRKLILKMQKLLHLTAFMGLLPAAVVSPIPKIFPRGIGALHGAARCWGREKKDLWKLSKRFSPFILDAEAKVYCFPQVRARHPRRARLGRSTPFPFPLPSFPSERISQERRVQRIPRTQAICKIDSPSLLVSSCRLFALFRDNPIH